MALLATYRRSLNEFTDRVGQVGSGQWTAPTPCADWDVRTLVNHVVGEDRWTVPMFTGATIAEVGDRFDGDLLGVDAAGAARDAAAQADLAVSAPGALDRIAHLSAGDTPAREYLHQLLAEHLVHGWDLAVAIGAAPRLDADAVRYCLDWFADRVPLYRDNDLIDARVEVPAEATDQDRLIAGFGREPNWRPPR
ncbi:TIGR03086 family metal-binding protein [Micromonospora sp. NPDC003197]